MRYFLACLSFFILASYNGLAQYETLIWKSDNEALLEFSPDGQSVLTKNSNNDTLFIREIPNMEVRYTFVTISGNFSAAAFSPNGDILATASTNGTIYLWNIKQQKIISVFNDAKRDTGIVYIRDLEFSPDGNNLALSSIINAVTKVSTIWVWNVANNSILWKKAIESQYVVFQYINSSSYLYIYDSIGRILNAQTGDVIKNIDKNFRIYSPNGKYFSLITTTTPNYENVIIYNAVADDSISILPLSSCQIFERAFFPNAEYIITSGVKDVMDRSSSIYLCEVKTGKILRQLSSSIESVKSVSSNSKYLIGLGGLYSFTLPTPVEEQHLHIFKLSATPNPASAQSLITFTLLKDSPVKLSVFDAAGREVLQLFSGQGSLGENRFQWNTENLPQGAYFIRLEADGKSAQVQCAVVR